MFSWGVETVLSFVDRSIFPSISLRILDVILRLPSSLLSCVGVDVVRPEHTFSFLLLDGIKFFPSSSA